MLWFRIEGARREDACAYADWLIGVSGIMALVSNSWGAGEGGKEDGGHIVGEELSGCFVRMPKENRSLIEAEISVWKM
jgi:hypothetical protein